MPSNLQLALPASILLAQLSDSVLVTDSEANIVFVNAAFVRRTGFRESDAIGKKPSILKSGLHSDRFYRDLWHTLRRDCAFRATFANRDAQGNLFHEEKTITPVNGQCGERYFVAVSRPVFAHNPFPHEHEHEHEHEREDALTGLLARSAFLNRLENITFNGSRGLLACLDIDRFGVANHALGDVAGDRFLQQAARRLENLVAGHGFAGRLGGDEFGAYIDTDNGADTRTLIGELQQLFDAPFEYADESYALEASIGVCLFPRDARNTSTLVGRAQDACHEAQQLGGGRLQMFSPALKGDPGARLRSGAELRLALHDSQFRLFFQPQVALADSHIVAQEALLRWQHPVRGLLAPSEFLEDLEASFVCHEAGLWVLREACRQFMSWSTSNARPLRLAVNLSPRQFTTPALAADVAKILEQTGMPPTQLEIEITETALMREARRATRVLQQLKDLGIRIAIDDFATGYSSLSYLMQFPVDVLKIPIEFVRELPGERQAREIVRTIIALARTLGAEVVAEGVTSDEQAKFLHVVGCDFAQGYLWQKPRPMN